MGRQRARPNASSARWNGVGSGLHWLVTVPFKISPIWCVSSTLPLLFFLHNLQAKFWHHRSCFHLTICRISSQLCWCHCAVFLCNFFAWQQRLNRGASSVVCCVSGYVASGHDKTLITVCWPLKTFHENLRFWDGNPTAKTRKRKIYSNRLHMKLTVGSRSAFNNAFKN